MSLGLLQQTEKHVLIPVMTMTKQIRECIRINPPEIVTIKDSEFIVDMNKMNHLEPCIVDFQGTQYFIWKNNDGALAEIVIE